MKPTKHPLRCECSTHPLIAYYGRDEDGLAYVHVASFKNRNPLSQVYSTDPVSIWCRVCGRWWNILIRNDKSEQVSIKERTSKPPVPEQKVKTRVLLDNPANGQ